MNKICVIGNSVAAPRTAEEAPLAGWGQYLGGFLGAGYEVRNYARDAMTLRRYFTGRFATLLTALAPGDMVFLAFGNVEQRINQLNRHHGPREYKEYLRLYAEAIRGEGAIPVLLTPAARCAFDETGNVVNTHDEYPGLTREAAAETGSPLIDMTALTTNMLAELGPTRARRPTGGWTPGSIRTTPTASSTPATSTTSERARWRGAWPSACSTRPGCRRTRSTPRPSPQARFPRCWPSSP